MARNVRRPGRGDDKTWWIVGLVSCVVVIIVLGVFVYLGYSGQTALEAAKKKAEKDATVAQKIAKRQQFQTLLLKATAGYARTKAADDKSPSDLENLTTLRRQYEGKDQDFSGMPDAEQKELADLVSQTKRDTAEDAVKEKKTLLDQIAALRTELDGVRTDLDKQQTAARQAQTDFDASTKKLRDEIKQKDGMIKQLNDDNLALKNSTPKQVTDVEDRNKKVNQDNEAFKRKVDDLKRDLDEKDTEIAKLKRGIQDEIEKRRIKEKETVKVSTLDYVQPWGKIVRLDRTGNMAYIDLGWADNARPQLTFSIAGRGADGKPKKDRKGSLEIVRVLDRKLSQAKITGVQDTFNDPVVSGDLIFNPAWNPNEREHVAITGVIDLTGDGTDNRAELMRYLDRQGVIVDAYLDLKDMSIKPKGVEGITTKTHYLILGDQPAYNVALGENKSNKAKEEIVSKVGEMATRARDEGVNIIGYRDFLMMIGYPRQQKITMSGTPESVLTGRNAAGATIEPGAAKDKKAAEKKEEPGDEDKPKEDKKEDKKEKAKKDDDKDKDK
jgi:hypothetical protein